MFRIRSVGVSPLALLSKLLRTSAWRRVHVPENCRNASQRHLRDVLAATRKPDSIVDVKFSVASSASLSGPKFSDQSSARLTKSGRHPHSSVNLQPLLAISLRSSYRATSNVISFVEVLRKTLGTRLDPTRLYVCPPDTKYPQHRRSAGIESTLEHIFNTALYSD